LKLHIIFLFKEFKKTLRLIIRLNTFAPGPEGKQF